MATHSERISKIEHEVEDHEQDIHNVKLAIYGDNNSRLGLIRRTDRIEERQNLMVKISTAILTMTSGLLIKAIFDFLTAP